MVFIMVKLILFLASTFIMFELNAAVLLNDQVREGDVYYSGIINQENNQQFFKTMSARKPRRLLISSSGGEVAAGIALGYWVHENKLDVVVETFCLSSCANYVFTAGVNKVIRPGAVVAWHGNYHHLLNTGLWKDEIATRMLRYQENRQQATAFVLEQVNYLVGLEQQFFRKIAVDEALCWIAKMPPYQVSDYYFLSVRDMARFGVRQVQAADNYPASDVSQWPVSITYIDLEK